MVPIRDPYLATFSRLTNEIYYRYYNSEDKKDLTMSFGTVNAGFHYTLDSSYQVDFLKVVLITYKSMFNKRDKFSLVPFPLVELKKFVKLGLHL